MGWSSTKFRQSAYLSALNNASILKFNNSLFALLDFLRTDSYPIFLKLPGPDPTCFFCLLTQQYAQDKKKLKHRCSLKMDSTLVP